jgi:hypothetical protein
MDTVPAYVDWRACKATPLSRVSLLKGSSKNPATDLPTAFVPYSSFIPSTTLFPMCLFHSHDYSLYCTCSFLNLFQRFSIVPYNSRSSRPLPPLLRTIASDSLYFFHKCFPHSLANSGLWPRHERLCCAQPSFWLIYMKIPGSSLRENLWKLPFWGKIREP